MVIQVNLRKIVNPLTFITFIQTMATQQSGSDSDEEIYDLMRFHSRNLIDPHNRMSRKALDRTYVSFFGVCPEVTGVIWALIKSKLTKKLKPKHLLWSLMFLKQYSNETVLCALANTTPKTLRKWVWTVLEFLGGTLYKEMVSNLKRIIFIKFHGLTFIF